MTRDSWRDFAHDLDLLEPCFLLAVRLGWRPSRLDDEAYGDMVEAAGGVDEWPAVDFTPEEAGRPRDDDQGGGMLFGCS
jgi:hypothetical protein